VPGCFGIHLTRNWSERNSYQISGAKTTKEDAGSRGRTIWERAPCDFNLRPTFAWRLASRVRVVLLWFLNAAICKATGGDSMPEPTYEELKAKLAELETKQQRTGVLQFKVSEKGGVSVYGLGRFPVTLYYEQWIRLLEASPKLREFLEENKSKLKLKTT
jgi:hypothetical protein